MDIFTLERLEKNPHYKLSEKQKAELAKLRAEKKPMVEFGKTPVHNSDINLHNIKIEKTVRPKKSN